MLFRQEDLLGDIVEKRSELKGGPQGPQQMLKKYFDLIDTDHDGSISQAELDAAGKLLQRSRGGGAPKPAQPAPAAAPTSAATPTAGGK